MSKERLRRGYTTGVHTVLAFCSALGVFVEVGGVVVSKNRKMDNDDLDVTKGAEIVVTVANSKSMLKLNPTPHKPYIFGGLHIFAGIGVGVVTKDGLKPPKDYPAINPTPLKSLKRCYEILGRDSKLFCAISIIDGEKLAKDTANSRVGVVGGLSILGTSGFVKPVSNQAFLDSIETQIRVLSLNGHKRAVFTLGNSSLRVATERFNSMEIIEIGNFIYDSFSLSKEYRVEETILVIGSAKALKIAQGFKNTHNRFGSIDFIILKKLISKELGVEIDIDSTKTLKGVFEQLARVNLDSKLKDLIEILAKERLESWFEPMNIKLILV